MSLKARFYIKTVSAKSTVRTQKIFKRQKQLLKFPADPGWENSGIGIFLNFFSENQKENLKIYNFLKFIPKLIPKTLCRLPS